MLGPRARPRIGLAWSGSALHKHDHNRSVGFAELIDALPVGFHYVSLQKELRHADRRGLAAHPEVFDAEPRLQDFSDTAALCDCLDLVLSVDTSVAHLAGALGRPTWILLPWYPDWRWQLDRDDSPWYPSVRLYRQTTPGDWRGVLERVARDLVRFFESNDPVQ
jgi:ADP-heptose:LPS heptosyltransferase